MQISSTHKKIFTKEHKAKADEVYNLIKNNHKTKKIYVNKYSLKPKVSLYCNIQQYSAKTEEDIIFWENVQRYILKFFNFY